MKYTFAIIMLLSFFSCKLTQQKTLITNQSSKIDSADLITIKNKFHYEQATAPKQYLSEFTPKMPMVEVYSYNVKDNWIWTSETRLKTFNSIVVKTKDTLLLLDTKEKFKKVFAPIDNEQEAISYVAYLTRSYPQYNIAKNSRYRVFSPEFPSTYAKRTNSGFEVLLHSKKIIGCGPHPYFYHIYTVTKSGEISLVKTVKMFEDPKEDDLCVD